MTARFDREGADSMSNFMWLQISVWLSERDSVFHNILSLLAETMGVLQTTATLHKINSGELSVRVHVVTSRTRTGDE